MSATPGELAAALRQALPPGFSVRPRTDHDLSFLRALYAHTREEELQPVDWPAQRKLDFLHDQFARQHAHYLQHYPAAQWWVITAQDEPIGRLYLEQTAAEIRLMDISLHASHRNRGLGSALVDALLQHAGRAGLPLTLHVEPFNPALRLYRRLGFEPVETRGIYLFMRRVPDAPVS